ncbi:MAG: hypothetical protein Fur0019_17970 [Tibeticola sp.]
MDSGIIVGMRAGSDGDVILGNLSAVAALRRVRASNAALSERSLAVKRYQHQRFQQTYADLLGRPEWRPAAVFFLDELYGPHDFSARDAQFERIVPALVRLFPPEIVGTVRQLSELHALSERLDDALAARWTGEAALDVRSYAQAWRAVGEPASRKRQIDLMLAVGRALIRYTRNPVLRTGLRLMRGPAELAGLSALQHFLETGFDTFRRLPDPEGFLGIIASREAKIAEWLFSENPVGEPPQGLT